jgi:hypothetical protein
MKFLKQAAIFFAFSGQIFAMNGGIPTFEISNNKLCIRNYNIDDRLCEKIEEQPETDKIDLSFCKISASNRFLSNKKWENIKYFYIETSNLNGGSCKKISKINFTDLKMLILRRNNIENSGVTHLSKMRGSYDFLHLGSNFLTYECYKNFVRFPNGKLTISVLYQDSDSFEAFYKNMVLAENIEFAIMPRTQDKKILNHAGLLEFGLKKKK